DSPHAPAERGEHTDRQVMVRPGDTLALIAQRELADANRWLELFALNRGTPQPDGHCLEHPDLILPGWTLALPAGPALPTHHLATAPPTAPHTPSAHPAGTSNEAAAGSEYDAGTQPPSAASIPMAASSAAPEVRLPTGGLVGLRVAAGVSAA